MDPGRRTVAGVTFAGPGVAELLHSATVAITGEIPVERLWHAVPPFPPSARCGCGCWRHTGISMPACS
ncbi:hypothetical protein [Nonomuraea rubra]|uniref:hypothetical protein n=1 Tax=Nonomuraea rubra TaxID=46180 RepID=UPI0028ACF55F|nr:hypothetical protein [Nonomuraea rubra]